jgi:hypothetical protein
MGVFWRAPPWLGTCGRQPVDNSGIDRNQVIQVDQVRGSQPDDTPGGMAGFSLAMVFFPVVSEWWRAGVSPVTPGAFKPFHKALVIPGSGNACYRFSIAY